MDKGRGDDEEGGADDAGPAKMETTNPQGPSFYYKDWEFWQNKFAKHNKERDAYKRHMARTQDINCLTRNTNIKDGEQTYGKRGKKSGASAVENADAKPSLFG